MATCKHCGAKVIQVLDASGHPILVDCNPDNALGMIRVDFRRMVYEILSLPARERAITFGEELYTNHMASCPGAEPARSYAEDTERMIGN